MNCYIVHNNFLYLASRDSISRITAAASGIFRIMGDPESSNPGMDADIPEVATPSTLRKLFANMHCT
jgi:hypothetical protein